MPAKSENENHRLEQTTQTVLQSAIYSQPWWRGVGNSLNFGETASKSSSAKNLNGSQPDGAIQSQANSGLDNGANTNKDVQISVASQPDGSNGLEHHLKQVASSTPASMDTHLEPNSQMELVGHSIVLTSYPYSDPQYGGMLASYAPQVVVPSQLYGMHHARIPLPLEMEEEPVFVNAKQFHGILRRRQARAKAELEKKAIKVRKPYLHESRHQHAMRRARGCGGRFLSNKKSESSSSNPASDEDGSSGANPSRQPVLFSGSEWLPKNGTGDLDSSSCQQEGKGSTAQEMQACVSSNGNAHGLSSMYHPPSSDGLTGGFLVLQRETTHRNGVSNGVLPIN
ncbi:hypothetical protein JCGZ_16766 [Jatropha curcas]|uniref:Nuclear transcription factor Y subunit n=1 Tax=Jatropha curcas TaxID=180498 RepID=A0A067LH09_JATCU|nr:nuclear transcription factor Y subunit A-1 [Jatropha curcas]XP_020532893.1 nuclear transcription factor Y subunit A-1 [Jatropha curcas]XP_020532894.1 nuclear transcription factor Y subunit A-1 [Jatropha curcas]XP_020532895.1 nuclear transcription factor Y subunit A-1 [Jatropha curcas]XP_037494188.1 nuclear transcription factor Y subunit A-1 [Jatropha curcas]XP_037494189.1 nuclear transcription factor Y subunit A-1 [Jatropha curcas]KDP43479.1 hypothetical protein JCGZ_16766 [Jatropha curcas